MRRKYRVEIAPSAEHDIRAEYEKIVQHRPVAARKWVRQVRGKIRALRSFPERYGIISEISDAEHEFRHYLFGNYRIIYRIETDRVFVLRVFHAARLLNPADLRRISEAQ